MMITPRATSENMKEKKSLFSRCKSDCDKPDEFVFLSIENSSICKCLTKNRVLFNFGLQVDFL
ncbi:hypothetical protein Ctha_2093 [Chloroherpeton thalassium ATCC 35110]|uniref:Uncharacterized protein n=1 Tax=Chloroherpeton thalassium (strain ATCC 35110 / GB-78) TaxID=517418 RepID=B3QVE5_CHLT3|nr:hypothetical protein Ctha_2093 [Chloroherpeton thalassium ATCC 35110]